MIPMVENMYTTSTGAFRSALDRLLARLRCRQLSLEEARYLALTSVEVARRFRSGHTSDELADFIASEIDS